MNTTHGDIVKDGAPVATTTYSDLDTLNAAFTDLEVVPDGTDTITMDIFVATADSDDAKALLTKEITVDPKVNELIATMTVTDFMQNVPKATAIEFSGKMEKDAASVIVTPIDCKIKGVKYAPNTEYDEDNPCSFTAESLEKINERFKNITLIADGMVGVQVKIVVDGGEPIIIDLTVAEYVPSTVIFTAPTFEGVEFKKDVESDPFDLDFTGTDVKEYDPVTVTITPENCAMKHGEDLIDAENPYVVTSDSKEDLTSKMTGFTLTPTAEENVKFALQYGEDAAKVVEVIDITVTPEPEPGTDPEEGDGDDKGTEGEDGGDDTDKEGEDTNPSGGE